VGGRNSSSTGLIARRGDPSDKLHGAPGVGPKRATQLLRQYGTLDGVLEAGHFQTQAEMLRLYQVDCDDECISAAALACRSGADMGLSIETCAHLGAKSVGGPFG
jgi:5'-3' exonuclease, C-terminal SAM fold